MRIGKITRQLRRKLRESRMFAKAMQSATHPILAQIVPIRRCNLDCGYCSEYDKTSDPVPLRAMIQRIDRLAGLGANPRCIRIWTPSSRGFASAAPLRR
jgi:hypothetical protein